MSYATIAVCVDDAALADRTQAAYAKEQNIAQPETAWYSLRWVIAADPSIEAPYASALAGQNPDPGGDESVITDGMLLAAVTAHPFTGAANLPLGPPAAAL